MYKKLRHDGTAETEAPELTNLPARSHRHLRIARCCARESGHCLSHGEEKYFAAADEIQRLHDSNQPVLVGTTSIEKSERLSELLKKKESSTSS